MKAQIFLCWVKMLSFIHSPFSEPTVLGSDETVFEQNNRAPLAPAAPQMCGGHFYWERESEGWSVHPLGRFCWRTERHLCILSVYKYTVYKYTSILCTLIPHCLCVHGSWGSRGVASTLVGSTFWILITGVLLFSSLLLSALSIVCSSRAFWAPEI